MALVTHDDLIDAIQSEFNDTTELTDAVVGDLITRAEVKINRRAKFRAQEYLKTATYDSSHTDRRLSAPSDMVEMLTLAIKKSSEDDSEYWALTYISPREMYNKLDHSLRWFTLRKDIEFNATVSEDHTVRMHFIGEWDLADSGTNTLMSKYPDMYLYGALVEVGLFMKDKDMIALYMPMFDMAIEELNMRDAKSRDDSFLDVGDLAKMTGGTYGYRGLIGYNILRG